MVNLRSCIERFQPYGFRATYHHLTVSARIPDDLAADPDSLLRAIEELDEARDVWLDGIRRLADRRREDKRRGVRAPCPFQWSTWGHMIWCSRDPRRHPTVPLVEFVRRQLARAEGEPLTGCVICGDEGPRISRATGHGFVDRCARCGDEPRPCRCGRWHPLTEESATVQP